MKARLLFLWLLLFPFAGYAEGQKAVTFGWGGRLGDNLLDYAHAKWVSYKWGIPLLFKDFQYADQFVFYDVEEHLTPQNSGLYTEKHLRSMAQLDEPIAGNTLYFIEHVPDSYDEWVFNGSYGLYIPIDWNDETFRDMMRKLIVPKAHLNLVEPPKEIVSVALHYRNGGGFVYDTDAMKRSLPLRFPESEYYIKQLRKLHLLVSQQPMYVYIFTDAEDPAAIKKMFKRAFPNKNIRFECRLNGNRHDNNVLEDMFSMMNFDCLIRPMSHYSMTASHLGNFKIDMYPTHGYWKDKHFYVDKVEIVQKAFFDVTKKKWVLKK